MHGVDKQIAWRPMPETDIKINKTKFKRGHPQHLHRSEEVQ